MRFRGRGGVKRLRIWGEVNRKWERKWLLSY